MSEQILIDLAIRAKKVGNNNVLAREKLIKEVGRYFPELNEDAEFKKNLPAFVSEDKNLFLSFYKYLDGNVFCYFSTKYFSYEWDKHISFSEFSLIKNKLNLVAYVDENIDQAYGILAKTFGVEFEEGQEWVNCLDFKIKPVMQKGEIFLVSHVDKTIICV